MAGPALVRIRKGRDEGLSLTPVIQAVLGLSAPDHGALMLHAASVALLGGRLFIGGSGAGKSTVAGSAEPGTVLSDDGSWCGFTGGRFQLYPTPFSQIDPAPKPPAPVPLTHVYFLEQSGDNRIVDISPGRAMTMLLRNHIHFFRFMGPRTAAKAFELAGEICARTPSQPSYVRADLILKPFLKGLPVEGKRPYDVPNVIDLRADYTQAAGVSQCVIGQVETGQ